MSISEGAENDLKRNMDEDDHNNPLKIKSSIEMNTIKSMKTNESDSESANVEQPVFGKSRVRKISSMNIFKRKPHTSDIIDNRRRASIVVKTDEEKRYFKETKNGWTPELELICQKIAKECTINKWLHSKNASILSDKLTRTTLAGAIISSVGGITNLSNYIANNYENTMPWLTPLMTLVGFFISLSVAIILIIQNTYNFPQKIENHRNSEQRYNWLYYEIQGQLQKPIEKRSHGYEYYRWIVHEQSNISNSEDYDDEVVELFYKTFEGGSIPGFDTIESIQINGESYNDSSDSTPNQSPIHNKKDTLTSSNQPQSQKSNTNLLNQSTNIVKNLVNSHGSDDEPQDKRKVNNDVIKHFKAQRDLQQLSLASNTLAAPRRNSAMIAFEMKRNSGFQGNED